MTPEKLTVFVGTYTLAGGGGIHELQFNLRSGELRKSGRVHAVPNPSYLALHPNSQWLYCVNEAEDFGRPAGLTAFQHSFVQGSQVNGTSESGGDCPAHLAIHPSGKALYVANYRGENFAVLALDRNGRMENAFRVWPQLGNPSGGPRQSQTHPHCTVVDRAGACLAVADLGLDCVDFYRLGPDGGIGERAPRSVGIKCAVEGAGLHYF